MSGLSVCDVLISFHNGRIALYEYRNVRYLEQCWYVVVFKVVVKIYALYIHIHRLNSSCYKEVVINWFNMHQSDIFKFLAKPPLVNIKLTYLLLWPPKIVCQLFTLSISSSTYVLLLLVFSGSSSLGPPIVVWISPKSFFYKFTILDNVLIMLVFLFLIRIPAILNVCFLYRLLC